MFVRVVDLPGAQRARWPSTSGSCEREPRERSFEIEPRGPRRHRLALRGALPPGFAAALLRGLSRHGIAVVGGHARRSDDGATRASFETEASRGAGDLLRLDVLELACTPPAPPPPGRGPRVVHRRVAPSGACGGSLLLDVTTAGPPGLSAALLEPLGGLGLAPCSLALERGRHSLRARIHLRGLAGGAPSPEQRRALEAHMARLGAAPPREPARQPERLRRA